LREDLKAAVGPLSARKGDEARSRKIFIENLCVTKSSIFSKAKAFGWFCFECRREFEKRRPRSQSNEVRLWPSWGCENFASAKLFVVKSSHRTRF